MSWKTRPGTAGGIHLKGQRDGTQEGKVGTWGTAPDAPQPAKGHPKVEQQGQKKENSQMTQSYGKTSIFRLEANEHRPADLGRPERAQEQSEDAPRESERE